MKPKFFFRAIFLSLVFLSSFFVYFLPAQAGFTDVFTQRFSGTIEEVYNQPADIQTVLPTAIGNFIRLILGFAGVILLVIITYASFLWLTARGNEDQVTKAKTWMKNGIIGLIITLLSFSITSFIVGQITASLQSSTLNRIQNAPTNSSGPLLDPGAIPSIQAPPSTLPEADPGLGFG